MENTIYFEDMELGQEIDVGSYLFEQDDMISFSRKYDPQPQHIDPFAAVDTYANGLIASGWHLCAVWMKLMINNRIQALKDDPEAPRVAGHGSPGFRDLKWFEPVRPGNLVTYRAQSVEKVDLKSRQDIGIIRSRNEAWIDNGKLAMTFTGQGLIGRRPTS